MKVAKSDNKTSVSTNMGLKKHGFQTHLAIKLSLITAGLFLVLSLVSNVSNIYHPQGGESSHRQLDDANNNNNNDFTYNTCDDIFKETQANTQERCQFAKECNGGTGLFLSFTFCNTHNMSLQTWCILLGPFLAIWLIVLFRMLGSTAEDYFSPSLEMFSTKMGLPPRFAGVTLLALGNGAADVSATINAIVQNPENGYEMSLGALTGAGMFVGTVVAGVVIVIADGVKCRGALVRDVCMFILTLAIVFGVFVDGEVGPPAIRTFLTLYAVFVLVVLIADIYHRAVVLPRLELERQNKERQRQIMEGNQAQLAATDVLHSLAEQDELQQFQQQQEQQQHQQHQQQPLSIDAQDIHDNNDIHDVNMKKRGKGKRALDAVLTALSNYDKESSTNLDDYPNEHDPNQNRNTGWGIDGEQAESNGVLLHGSHGILNRQYISAVNNDTNDNNNHNPNDNMESGTNFSSSSQYHAMPSDADDENLRLHPLESLCTTPGIHGLSASNWHGAYHDNKQELYDHSYHTYADIYLNEENSILDKVLLTCELPFIIARKLTVPIPCDGYYHRAIVALSFALSPLWFGLYLILEFDSNLFFFGDDGGGIPFIEISFLFFASLSLLLLRFAPSVDGAMSLTVSVPIAFWGFVIAATWIDAIADQLVRVLTFLGVVFKIPNSIMGLTILAWGNSMGDLSANMTMARKGLANMAITACFAGPVFNILLGLGGGFASLSNITGNDVTKVDLSPSIVVGFFFLLCNCILILVFGLVWSKGSISSTYGYIACGLYALYIICSFVLQFTGNN